MRAANTSPPSLLPGDLVINTHYGTSDLDDRWSGTVVAVEWSDELYGYHPQWWVTLLTLTGRLRQMSLLSLLNEDPGWSVTVIPVSRAGQREGWWPW